MEEYSNWRHELKYEIDFPTYLTLKQRLRWLMQLDPHVDQSGRYQIISLYFDNCADQALREKLDGINRREKFRLRYYNNDVSAIMLEKKQKVNGLCLKTSAPIPKTCCEKLIRGDANWRMGQSDMLLLELECKMKHQLLRPRTLVSYVREPYVYDAGNVRVTFDMQLRTGPACNSFLCPGALPLRILPQKAVILEVKYDAYLPQLIADALQEGVLRMGAYSKYAGMPPIRITNRGDYNMTFNDIFKSSFLESVSEFSLTDTAIGLAFALVVGLFIFLIYKKTLTGILYSSGLALTLVGLTMVTTLVIMTVTSNVVLSLGMVGALSIVRFRAAIKEPVEIVFLFWSLAAGIVIGAGMIPLAMVGSVIIGLTLLVLANRKRNDNPYMLILQCANEAGETQAMELLKTNGGYTKIKAKTVTRAGIELTVEVKLKDASTAFLNRLSEVNGVESAALVSYNGEYMS